MAGRNSGNQNRGRGARGQAPAPLYDRVEDLRGVSLSTPRSCAQDRLAARTALERTDMHVVHNSIPLPASCRTTDQTADLLCRQNELLTEILGVLNAQLAVCLGQRPR